MHHLTFLTPSSGHRHRPLHDFGYVALDIVGTIPEDNGIYTCRATNGLGYDETSAILKTSREYSKAVLNCWMHKLRDKLYNCAV